MLLSPLESLSTESTKNVVDMRNPARGGLGFTLMLLFDVAITAADVCLSALKYLINLLEMHRGPLNTSVSSLLRFSYVFVMVVVFFRLRRILVSSPVLSYLYFGLFNSWNFVR